MAHSIERTSPVYTSYPLRTGPAGVSRAEALSFARVLAEARFPAEPRPPAVFSQNPLEAVFLRPASVAQMNGTLYGWSYHNLPDGTMCFRTTAEATDGLKRFMGNVSENFNRIEAAVVARMFKNTDTPPRGMSVTFIRSGILYLLSGPHHGKSETYEGLLRKVNAMYENKHYQINREWLALLSV